MFRASPSTARIGILIAAAALSLAACSNSTPGATAAASSAAPAASASSAASASAAAGLQITVVQDAKLGAHLAGANGMALYVFTKDSKDTSNCTAQCAATWPPLEVAAGASATAGAGVTGTLATIKRSDDGRDQVTYNGAPLYYYGGDRAPSDVLGQGLKGIWFLAAPGTTATGGTVSGGVGESGGGGSAAPSSAASAPAASPAASSSSSGGGY